MYRYQDLRFKYPQTEDDAKLIKVYFDKMLSPNAQHLFGLFCKLETDVTHDFPFKANSTRFDVTNNTVEGAVEEYVTIYTTKLLEQVNTHVTKIVEYLEPLTLVGFMGYINEIAMQFNVSSNRSLEGSEYPKKMLLLRDDVILELAKNDIYISHLNKFGLDVYICNKEQMKPFGECNGLMFINKGLGTYAINLSYPLYEHDEGIYNLTGQVETITPYTGPGAQIFGLRIATDMD